MSANDVPPEQQPKFDPTFTSSVINAIGRKTTPRVRQLATSLIQHVHDFARENELTMEEFLAGIDLVHT